MAEIVKRDILNIKEASARAKACGMNISEYTLRRVIRSGELPCRTVGRTYLISWEKLVAWATCVDAATMPSPSNYHIIVEKAVTDYLIRNR